VLILRIALILGCYPPPKDCSKAAKVSDMEGERIWKVSIMGGGTTTTTTTTTTIPEGIVP
jgi:hypothetical protein